MANELLDLQYRSMRDSIIIHGIPQQEKETCQKTELLVKSFLKDDLKMDEREMEAIRFCRVHRIGQAIVGKQRPRSVVAKVMESKMKSAIMEKGIQLKGSNFFITGQYPPEFMKRWRLLYQS